MPFRKICQNLAVGEVRKMGELSSEVRPHPPQKPVVSADQDRFLIVDLLQPTGKILKVGTALPPTIMQIQHLLHRPMQVAGPKRRSGCCGGIHGVGARLGLELKQDRERFASAGA